MLISYRLRIALSVITFAFLIAPPVGSAELQLGTVSMSAHIIQIGDSLKQYHCVGKAELVQDDIRLTADELEVDAETGHVSASGNVEFRDSESSLQADFFNYNFLTATGELASPVARHGPVILRGESASMLPVEIPADQEDRAERKLGALRLLGASATTCDRESPHYKLTAKEISLYPGEPPRVLAKGVAVWLGNTRLLKLPNVSFKLSGDASARRSLFPRMGFDGDDGFFAGYGFPLVSSERDYVVFTARGTARQGFHGRISLEHLLSGNQVGLLEPSNVYSTVELRLIPLLRMEGETLLEEESHSSETRLFANLSHRQKTYDFGVDQLWLSKLPEVGLQYYSTSSGGKKPGGSFSQAAMLTYGRISESPGLKNIGRLDARALLNANWGNLGERTALSTNFLARYSSYDTGDNYSVFAGSLNVAHRISSHSYASVRLIKHFTSGSTPLESDDVDIDTELQGALWHRFGKNIVGAEVDYDFRNRRVFDWGLTYGRTMHCLEPQITWRNRFSTIDLDVKVLGF